MKNASLTARFSRYPGRILLLSESQISLATARHLGKLGNAIVSLALPGD